MIIDAHQHFWAPARGDYLWMNNNPAVAAIHRDILPADLEPHRLALGIDKTVLVQAAATIEETEYMLGLADATPWIAKVVGWIDFEKPADRKHLERLAKHRKFSGVRPMIQDLPDVNWMLRPDVQWTYQALIDLDLTFDALGFPAHLANFRRIFDRYPTMRTVIDHGMKPVIREGKFEPWAGAMAKIASETPVFCKLSGLATEAAKGWSTETLRPYAEHLITSFGADRLMWGSDWPVLDLAGSYEDWYQSARGITGEGPAAKAIFGATAAKFYRIS